MSNDINALRMKTVFFSSNIDTIDEWKMRHYINSSISCFDIEELNNTITTLEPYILIADYDSVSNEINTFISSNTVGPNVIVLEKTPEILTGKMLISHGIKAYGNARMLTHHYNQMIQTVIDKKIWTYPELTAYLAKKKNSSKLNDHSVALINNKLSIKESEVIYLILNGLTNDAIANKMNITSRTVKAHVSSIFKKLHINDRLSLVLLLK